MSKYKNHPMTSAARAKMEYEEYAHKLNDEELEFAEKFYKSYYADLISELDDDEQLLKADDAIKEARRNHNSHMHDAFEVTGKSGQLDYVGENQEFMEAASDEWEWKDAYKIGGYELASQTIFLQSIRDLKSDGSTNSWMATLARTYVKMNELRKLQNRVYAQNKKRNNK